MILVRTNRRGIVNVFCVVVMLSLFARPGESQPKPDTTPVYIEWPSRRADRVAFFEKRIEVEIEGFVADKRNPGRLVSPDGTLAFLLRPRLGKVSTKGPTGYADGRRAWLVQSARRWVLRLEGIDTELVVVGESNEPLPHAAAQRIRRAVLATRWRNPDPMARAGFTVKGEGLRIAGVGDRFSVCLTPDGRWPAVDGGPELWVCTTGSRTPVLMDKWEFAAQWRVKAYVGMEILEKRSVMIDSLEAIELVCKAERSGEKLLLYQVLFLQETIFASRVTWQMFGTAKLSERTRWIPVFRSVLDSFRRRRKSK